MPMGRPRKSDPDKRSYSLKIRFNQEEERRLNECADYYSMKKTEVMMAGLDVLYDDMMEEKSNGQP